MTRGFIAMMVASLSLAGCGIDRGGLAAPDGEGRDAGCASGFVDLNGDPSDGCECVLSVPPDEQCNAVDDDCDGSVDEDCSCVDGETHPCGTDVGECVAGLQTCSGGRLSGPCVGEVAAVTETCERAMLDDDCDGMVNEGCGCTEGDMRSCTGAGCPGMQTCRIDGTWRMCVSIAGAAETCNGVDDDCNGVVDDGPATSSCATMTGCDVHHRSGGNTYVVCEIDASWAVGAALCTGIGYTHVTVSDAAEETYLLGLMRMYTESQWWGGLCDGDGDGTYADSEWMGPPSSHRNWQGSQPDEVSHCIRIRDTDGQWDDQPPSYGRGTICESPPP